MRTIKEMRAETGLSQAKFGDVLGIPKRTIQDWESAKNKPTVYLTFLIEHYLVSEGLIKAEN